MSVYVSDNTTYANIGSLSDHTVGTYILHYCGASTVQGAFLRACSADITGGYLMAWANGTRFYHEYTGGNYGYTNSTAPQGTTGSGLWTTIALRRNGAASSLYIWQHDGTKINVHTVASGLGTTAFNRIQIGTSAVITGSRYSAVGYYAYLRVFLGTQLSDAQIEAERVSSTPVLSADYNWLLANNTDPAIDTVASASLDWNDTDATPDIATEGTIVPSYVAEGGGSIIKQARHHYQDMRRRA